MADKISGAADKVSDFIRRMSGATGVNSLWLEKAARSGMLNLDTATADDVYRLASQMAGRQAPARQLELPLGPGAAEPDIRALIPYGTKGPGVPTRLAAEGVPVHEAGALIPAPPKRLPAPPPTGLAVRGSSALTQGPGATDLAADLAPAPQRIANEFDRATGRGKPDYGPWKAAAGAAAGAGLVGGAAQYMKSDGSSRALAPEMTSTAGTADLVNESRPAPTVAPEDEQAFTEKFKRQYTAREQKREAKGQGGYANKPAPQSDPRAEAQALIADLNERRRKAGGEVPDAQQTMARINDLLSKSNQQRNSRSPQEAAAVAKGNPSDYHAQAQALIAQLNDMRRQAGREVPQAPQIMAEVRRLQAMGDQQRNAAQTGRY